MENRYLNWKQQPFPSQQSSEVVISKIKQLIEDLSVFYGLTGLQPNEAEAIFSYITHFLKSFPKFKLIDMDRALELFKKRPDLNKLCPEYFETVFNHYRKTSERIEILKQWDLETENLISESATKTPEQLLAECFADYKLSGEIKLNSGKVYKTNFKALSEAIGIKPMQDIAQAKIIELSQNFTNKIESCRNMSERHEAEKEKKDFLDELEHFNKTGKPTGLLQVEIRKAHLREYFEKHYQLVKV